MNDHEAIRRVIALYCQLIDDKRFDAWSELFADDGAFVARGMAIEGRANIREQISKLMAEATTKHTAGQPVIDIQPNGTEAYVWTDVVTFAKAGDVSSIATLGRCYDHLRRSADGRWRIARREMVLTGGAAPEHLRQPPDC